MLLLTPLAFAFDLDVSVRFDEEKPVEMTFYDVVTVPVLTLTDPQARARRFTIHAIEHGADQVEFEVEMGIVTTDRRGRETLFVSSRPRVRALVAEEARVLQGPRVPNATGFEEQEMEIVLVARREWNTDGR